MCGRFRLTRSQKYLEEHFDASGEVEALCANIAETLSYR
jgi:putative SOS response-associated peptidase YedK